MSDATTRLALPLLQPGQAQKELFHNEALTLIDLAIQPVVEDVLLDTPPAAPAPGQCWIVGTSPSGAWAGAPQALAGWTEGGWRFVPARSGAIVWNAKDATLYQYLDGNWQRAAARVSGVIVNGKQVVGTQGVAISQPTGGSVIDSQSRTAINAILGALQQHGLIAG